MTMTRLRGVAVFTVSFSLVFSCLTCVLIVADGSSWATTYTFTEIDVPGSTNSLVKDINDSGQMTVLSPASGVKHLYEYQAGTFTLIAPPGSTESAGGGINNSGQIVGFNHFGPPDMTNSVGFLLSGGAFTSFGVGPAVPTEETEAFGINSNGLIAGDYCTGPCQNHLIHNDFAPQGYIKNGNTITYLDITGSIATEPRGINDSGQVVGYYYDSSGGQHGFLLSASNFTGTNYTAIDVNGATSTQAYRINNSNQIVGGFVEAGVNHGFLLNGTTTTEIDVPGAQDTFLQGINNNGYLVGGFQDSHGNLHGFLATPTGMPVLPSVSSGGVFEFNVMGTSGAPIILDPSVATGYQYQVTTGSPFGSVLIPDQIGNSHYALYVWNGSQYVFNSFLSAGTTFNFGPNGVSRFEILGIDPNAGVDPTNPLAFPTTVTFLGTGAENVTMTPLTSVATPEPSTLLLLGIGLAGLTAWRRRMKRA